MLFFTCLVAFAQNVSVKSFKPLPMDMTAISLEGKRLDQNGEVAALIKVVTTEKDFSFEGGTLGIVDSQQRKGEVWVWVPRGLRKITILHEKLGVLRDYRFPVEIEAERTYEMVLTTAKIETIVKEEVHQQYLTFQISPANATLEVNDKLWSVDNDGIATKYVEFGTYTYRVRAADYFTDAGVVTVDDPDNTKFVTVTLKPDFAEVTLKVDADAEIWVNNEKKGIRIWKGNLGNGVYKMECKQACHETSTVSKEITAEMNGQTITLPAPTPIYGSLNVESNPNMATVYIDGKEMGKTPKSINEILIGKHEVRIIKDGYAKHTETVVISKGERKQVLATLNKASATPPSAQPKKPVAQQPAAQKQTSVFFVMANAAYSIAPQTLFGLTVGSAKKLGWYVSLGTNFNFNKPTAAYICDENGDLVNTDNVFEYQFTGETTVFHYMATAGMAVRISDPLYAYFGGGYGQRELYWQLVKTDGSLHWAHNRFYSYDTLALDAGLQLHYRGLGLSLGVQTIGFNLMEAKLGIGYTFKK